MWTSDLRQNLFQDHRIQAHRLIKMLFQMTVAIRSIEQKWALSDKVL